MKSTQVDRTKQSKTPLRKEDFPMPKDAVLMLDLDRTLIDSNYRTNVPIDRLKTSVDVLASRGWSVGLNSNSPIETMRVFGQKLGITGPKIAEQGAIVVIGERIVYTSPEDIKAFALSFSNIAERLRNSKFRVEIGTPIELISKGVTFAKPGERVIFLNNLRRSSIGIFTKIGDAEGKLVTDAAATIEIAKDVDSLLPDMRLVKDVNSKAGAILVMNKGITKRTGTKALMELLRLDEIGMIGDSRADYLGSDISKTYAVANATEEFKAKADYVSKFELTAGVVDVMQKLRD